MCIRDSFPTASPGTPGIFPETGHAIAPEFMAAWSGGGLDPVSYTHLRAHETVLDLVCRLLLEKNKNNMTINTLTYYTSVHQLAVSHQYMQRATYKAGATA